MTSIIIDTKNSHRFLHWSLTSLLSQSKEDELEVIVVDSSTDTLTGELCHSYFDRLSIKYMKNVNHPEKSQLFGVLAAKLLFQSDRIIHKDNRSIEKLSQVQVGERLIPEAFICYCAIDGIVTQAALDPMDKEATARVIYAYDVSDVVAKNGDLSYKDTSLGFLSYASVYFCQGAVNEGRPISGTW